MQVHWAPTQSFLVGLAVGALSVMASCIPGWCGSDADCQSDERCSFDRRCVGQFLEAAASGSSSSGRRPPSSLAEPSTGTSQDTRPTSPSRAEEPEDCAPAGGSLADPDHVHLLGTLSPGTSGFEVLMDLQEQSLYLMGLTDVSPPFRLAVIRGLDGTVFFEDTAGQVRQLEADGEGYDVYRGVCRYPLHALHNDPVVPFTQCAELPSHISLFSAPEGNAVVVECAMMGGYVDSDGLRVYDGPHRLLAIGRGRRLLLVGRQTTAPQSLLIQTPDGTLHTVTGLPDGDGSAVAAIRSTAQGFMLAVALADGPRELWDISDNGTATRRGVYAAFPDTPASHRVALDAQGALYLLGNFYRDGGFVDAVVRLGFAPLEPVDVFVESSASPVKIHSGALVTGP